MGLTTHAPAQSGYNGMPPNGSNSKPCAWRAMLPQPRAIALSLVISICIYAQLRMALEEPHTTKAGPLPAAARVGAPAAVSVAPQQRSQPRPPHRPPPSPPPPPPPPSPPPLASPVAASAASATRAATAPSAIHSSNTADNTAVHVVVCADREHWAGVIGVINSVRRNCAQSARLRLHVVVTAGTEGAFGAFLRCHGMDQDGLDVLGFSAKRLPKIKVRTLLTNLESPLNFARFYLQELLPGVPKARGLRRPNLRSPASCRQLHAHAPPALRGSSGAAGAVPRRGRDRAGRRGPAVGPEPAQGRAVRSDAQKEQARRQGRAGAQRRQAAGETSHLLASTCTDHHHHLLLHVQPPPAAARRASRSATRRRCPSRSTASTRASSSSTCSGGDSRSSRRRRSGGYARTRRSAAPPPPAISRTAFCPRVTTSSTVRSSITPTSHPRATPHRRSCTCSARSRRLRSPSSAARGAASSCPPCGTSTASAAWATAGSRAPSSSPPRGCSTGTVALAPSRAAHAVPGPTPRGATRRPTPNAAPAGSGPNKPFGGGKTRAHEELFKPYAGRGDACKASRKGGADEEPD